MFTDPLDDHGDREIAIVEMSDQFSAPVDQLLIQLTTHGFQHSKETLCYLLTHIDHEANPYYIGAVLHFLRRRCQPAEFRHIIDGSRFEMRTAAYLMAIYVKFRALQRLPPPDIPWRTLGEAVRMMNAYNYDEIIELCRDNDAFDLRRIIAKRRVDFL